jgi:hypothetical protein
MIYNPTGVQKRQPPNSLEISWSPWIYGREMFTRFVVFTGEVCRNWAAESRKLVGNSAVFCLAFQTWETWPEFPAGPELRKLPARKKLIDCWKFFADNFRAFPQTGSSLRRSKSAKWKGEMFCWKIIAQKHRRTSTFVTVSGLCGTAGTGWFRALRPSVPARIGFRVVIRA